LSRVFARAVPCLAGSVLVMYASLGLLYELRFRNDMAIERLLCRFHLCFSDVLREEAFRQLLSSPEGAPRAVEGFREAVRRDPAHPYRWCELGEALVEAGDTSGAAACISRALELGPNSAPLILRAANLHFRFGQTRRALELMSRVLGLTDEYDEIVFGTYSRMGVTIADALAHGLPHDRAARGYLRFLMARGNLQDARELWGGLRARSLGDRALTAEYVGFLVRNRQYEPAADTWASEMRQRGYRETNLVYNGSFDEELTGGPFDWTIEKVNGVRAERDSSIAHSGRWSLRIQFDGKENVAYRHVSQVTVASAGTYRFTAWIRTAGLTTDEGLRFRLYDVESPARLAVETENLYGSMEWRRIEKTLQVSAATRLLGIAIVRRQSMKFDSKIAGTAWVDEVALARRP
jgi:hypothetical protein